MLRKLTIISIIIILGCNSKYNENNQIINIVLDDHFYITGNICSFAMSQIFLNPELSIYDPCIQHSVHRKTILDNYSLAEINISNNESFLDSSDYNHIKQYLEKIDLSNSDTITSNFSYHNEAIFSSFTINDDIYKDNKYDLLVSKIYFNNEKRKAVIAVLSKFLPGEIFEIYFLRKHNETWIIDFTGVSD